MNALTESFLDIATGVSQIAGKAPLEGGSLCVGDYVAGDAEAVSAFFCLKSFNVCEVRRSWGGKFRFKHFKEMSALSF